MKYPKILRDFSFIFDKHTTFKDVEALIKNEASNLLKSVSIFDLFESKEFGAEKKSMAFSLEYFDYGRTLTEEEVERDFQKLINAVTDKFNAQLRGN